MCIYIKLLQGGLFRPNYIQIREHTKVLIYFLLHCSCCLISCFTVWVWMIIFMLMGLFFFKCFVWFQIFCSCLSCLLSGNVWPIMQWFFIIAACCSSLGWIIMWVNIIVVLIQGKFVLIFFLMVRFILGVGKFFLVIIQFCIRHSSFTPQNYEFLFNL